ncbi:MAG: hypothetical protein F6K41_29620, partial [Symploca sp. SIO3E6]|nr:hypothetical protein [Caldora sp. SIO3E6]
MKQMVISWVLIPIGATVYWNIGEQKEMTAAALNSPVMKAIVATRTAEGIAKATDDCDPNSPEGCSSTLDPRSPDYNCNTPNIITPNNTALLNNQPPISWYAVPGATSYTVRVKDIMGLGLDWERKVTEPPQNGVITINYPDDVESLIPGKQYMLTVEPRFDSTDKPVELAESILTMLSRDDIEQAQEIDD